VTDDVLSFDVDTGRSGVQDPGDVGRATLSLFDPVGAYGIAGDRIATGHLVRAFVEANGERRPVFFGRVSGVTAALDLVVPVVTVGIDDGLSAALAHDDVTPLLEQTTSDRLATLLDLGGWPRTLRDIEPDPTLVAGVEVVGNLLDHARNVTTAAGGTLWADGSGVVVYRDRSFGTDVPEPDQYLTTDGTGTSPSGLALNEALDRVANDVTLANTDDPPLVDHQADADSIARYGRRPLVLTDVLTVDPAAMRAVGARKLALAADPLERVDPCDVIVQDDPSAATVLRGIGDLVNVTYTGSDPWTRLLMVGGFAQSIGPEEWRVSLRLYDALALAAAGPAAWGTATWGVSTWDAPTETKGT
jgi:hypothetical protein